MLFSAAEVAGRALMRLDFRQAFSRFDHESGDDLRVAGGDIFGLTRIGGEVEETGRLQFRVFPRAGLFRFRPGFVAGLSERGIARSFEEELPLAMPDRCEIGGGEIEFPPRAPAAWARLKIENCGQRYDWGAS